LLALCLGTRGVHAQAAPLSYWTPGWPIGFGGNLAADQTANSYGDFPNFDGNATGGGRFSSMRYSFPTSWNAGPGLGMSGFNQYAAFGSYGSLYREGMQFGYKLQNDVTLYGGFDALKYNTGMGGPFAAFESTSGTLPAYGAHAGIQFQAAPNVSLSLGFDYSQQQSGRVDSDINSPLVPGATPYAFTSGRR
jgi:opacity protein-like surface antigen